MILNASVEWGSAIVCGGAAAFYWSRSNGEPFSSSVACHVEPEICGERWPGVVAFHRENNGNTFFFAVPAYAHVATLFVSEAAAFFKVFGNKSSEAKDITVSIFLASRFFPDDDFCKAKILYVKKRNYPGKLIGGKNYGYISADTEFGEKFGQL